MKEKSEEKISEKLDNLNKSYTRFFPIIDSWMGNYIVQTCIMNNIYTEQNVSCWQGNNCW